MIWINQIVQGALLGGYYALIACGLSFLFSVMRIINLAHGSLAILASYALFALADNFGTSPFLGLIVVVPAMAALGWFLQRTVIERSSHAGPPVQVLSTFGLSIVIDNLLFQGFGADTRSLAPYVGTLSYDSFGLTDDISLGSLALLAFATAVVLLGGLQFLLSRTALGRAIRATFAPYAGAAQLLFAFETTVIGGVGSLWGTLAGGVVLGVAQSLGAQLHPQGFLIAGHAAFRIVVFVRLASAARGGRLHQWLGGVR